MRNLKIMVKEFLQDIDEVRNHFNEDPAIEYNDVNNARITTDLQKCIKTLIGYDYSSNDCHLVIKRTINEYGECNYNGYEIVNSLKDLNSDAEYREVAYKILFTYNISWREYEPYKIELI